MHEPRVRCVGRLSDSPTMRLGCANELSRSTRISIWFNSREAIDTFGEQVKLRSGIPAPTSYHVARFLCEVFDHALRDHLVKSVHGELRALMKMTFEKTRIKNYPSTLKEKVFRTRRLRIARMRLTNRFSVWDLGNSCHRHRSRSFMERDDFSLTIALSWWETGRIRSCGSVSPVLTYDRKAIFIPLINLRMVGRCTYPEYRSLMDLRCSMRYE